ncbi:hypothetical protein [Herminiimonas contaminans]|uniref:Uncharacterized protein n=1 Tax=Herminiimonas contaminans TaxID=1111140 RepID=A0ABS0EWB5_9BURK|nr:hypothetical protein [Herminiimonas contaminans]MBF8179140.1 hypothetical protein [Herminiimonas contaminans]
MPNLEVAGNVGAAPVCQLAQRFHRQPVLFERRFQIAAVLLSGARLAADFVDRVEGVGTVRRHFARQLADLFRQRGDRGALCLQCQVAIMPHRLQFGGQGLGFLQRRTWSRNRVRQNTVSDPVSAPFAARGIGVAPVSGWLVPPAPVRRSTAPSSGPSGGGGASARRTHRQQAAVDGRAVDVARGRVHRAHEFPNVGTVVARVLRVAFVQRVGQLRQLARFGIGHCKGGAAHGGTLAENGIHCRYGIRDIWTCKNGDVDLARIKSTFKLNLPCSTNR